MTEQEEMDKKAALRRWMDATLKLSKTHSDMEFVGLLEMTQLTAIKEIMERKDE